MAAGPAERFGRGPVTVALLLPLSGNPALSQLGTALANASRLAIAFIEANPNIGENVTISLRDTGDSAAGATSAASAALAEGAKLILGPVTAEQVTAAGAVARASGVPVIGFANNGSVAGQGVYVLNVLPETEMKRALTWLMSQGRRGPAGIFPATPYGEALAAAFRTQAIGVGFNPSAVYTFSDISEAQSIIAQAKPLVERGMLDALFIPDRASAPTFASLLAQSGTRPDDVQLVGSADWANDPALTANPALVGAIFPAVDEVGLNAIRADYQARFGSAPPQMATIAYTATILANVNTLSLATPPYSPQLLANPSGFAGRDGLFRFNANGRSDYALVIRKVGAGGVVTTADAAKI
jgi:branched-chain amino acid transport system substrate-binding protein